MREKVHFSPYSVIYFQLNPVWMPLSWCSKIQLYTAESGNSIAIYRISTVKFAATWTKNKRVCWEDTIIRVIDRVVSAFKTKRIRTLDFATV